MVWSGWDFSGGHAAPPNFNSMINAAGREEPRRLVDHRSVVRVHRDGQRDDADPRSRYPAATLDKSQGDAHAPRTALNDTPQVVSRRPGWEYTSTRRRFASCPPAPRSSRPTSTSSAYTAKDPTVNGIGFAAVRDFIAFLRYADRGRLRQRRTRSPATSTRVYTEVLVAARPHAERLPLPAASTRPRPARRCSTATCSGSPPRDGINLNLRFSQPGRTERNRQDHLYAEGLFPFANESTTDPLTGKTAGRYDTLHGRPTPARSRWRSTRPTSTG